MEEWSRWLLNSLVERTASSGLCTAGELAVLAQGEKQPSDWWSVQLAGSPSAAARLIRLANSAAFGRGAPAVDLPSAIDTLGHRTARHLLFMELLERLFPGKGRDWVAWAPRWRHSIAVAAASATLARKVKLAPGEVFVAGLLHDLGQLVLLRQGGEPYERLERTFGVDPDASRLAREETDHLGFDHGLLGASIAARWGLPAAVVSILRDHHRLEALAGDIHPGPHLNRVAVVELAEKFAEALGYGPRGAEAMVETREAWKATLNALVDCPANQVLKLSRFQLNRLRKRIEARIQIALQVAKGGEGELWEAPGVLDRISSWAHGVGPRLQERAAGWAPAQRPRALPEVLKPATSGSSG